MHGARAVVIRANVTMSIILGMQMTFIYPNRIPIALTAIGEGWKGSFRVALLFTLSGGRRRVTGTR